MTKDVIVSVTGLRHDSDNQEVVEVISRGIYYYRNEKHYVIYEELSEDAPNEVTKCLLKISKNRIELIRHGYNHSHMDFELNQNNISGYSTPFGELIMGIKTTCIEIEESDALISANLQYELEINYEHSCICDLKIEVVLTPL